MPEPGFVQVPTEFVPTVTGFEQAATGSVLPATGFAQFAAEPDWIVPAGSVHQVEFVA